MSTIKDFTLYNAISATPTTPAEIVINDKDSIKINLSGTNTSRTINFKTKFSPDDTNPLAIVGYNHTTGKTGTSTTSNNENWQFDSLSGFYSLVIDVTALSGGNLTVKVKVID